VTVVSNENSGPNTKILRLRVSPNLIPKDGQDPIGFGPIWSVYIKDDDIQVERPYTPLESIDEDGNMVLWIKKYPRGEVGRWLHLKKPGETIEIRGPLKTWPWKDGEWDEVVMVSTLLTVIYNPASNAIWFLRRYPAVQELLPFISSFVKYLSAPHYTLKILDLRWFMVHVPLKSYHPSGFLDLFSLTQKRYQTNSDLSCSSTWTTGQAHLHLYPL
jgi:hypothetical protein